MLRADEICYLDDFFRCKHKNELRELLNRFYEIDALFSMAKATEKYKLTFPEFQSSQDGICLKGLYHLLLSEGKRNDFEVEDGKNVVLLTGPNMSGKSTYLKACGVAVFLAHVGMGIPAESATLPVFDDIVAALNARDDIERGHSSFYSEINRIAEIATLLNGQKSIFVLIDEMFKGTNFTDALGCSEAIIQKLLLWKSSVFLLSTHMMEVAKKFRDQLQYNCFESLLKDGEPAFTYAIKKGISIEKLGLILLKQSRVQQLLTPD